MAENLQAFFSDERFCKPIMLNSWFLNTIQNILTIKFQINKNWQRNLWISNIGIFSNLTILNIKVIFSQKYFNWFLHFFAVKCIINNDDNIKNSV